MASHRTSINKAEGSPTGKKYALLVGIQRYHDSTRIHGVAHAEQDVASLREALLALGYTENNIVLLANDHATKTAIEH